MSALIKYRFRGVVDIIDGQVAAGIDRLADLVLFDGMRTPTQKAFDQTWFTERICLETLSQAKRENPENNFKARYVIEQMDNALFAIKEYKLQHGMKL